MLAIHAEGHAAHDPAFFLSRGRPIQCPEVPERAERLFAALQSEGHEISAPARHGRGPLLRVHTAQYLDFLERAYEQWQALQAGSDAVEVIANVHPNRYRSTYPESFVGRAGWHMADTACPLGEHTFEAACLSADVALTAAVAVLDGAPHAYALCRPPGHHAYGDMAGGFCFINNSAVAAAQLRKVHERVAIIDIDVHHGNGTQGIFYERGDVLTVSTHAAPDNYYPFYWGYAHERGAGAGEGANLNLPLAHGSGDDELLKALERARPLIRSFDPGAIIVALGLDASVDDPLGVLKVTPAGFQRACAFVAGLERPTVVVQEGGYLSDSLGANLAHALRGFA